MVGADLSVSSLDTSHSKCSIFSSGFSKFNLAILRCAQNASTILGEWSCHSFQPVPLTKSVIILHLQLLQNFLKDLTYA